MAKSQYIGVNNVARKIKGVYVGVNGVARKVKKAYIGVNGVARLFYSNYTWNRYTVNTIWTASLYARYTDYKTNSFLIFVYNCDGSRNLKVTKFSNYADSSNSTCTLTCDSSTGIFSCSNYRGSTVRYNANPTGRFDYEAEIDVGMYQSAAVILEYNPLDISSVGEPVSSEDYGYSRQVNMYPGSHHYAFRRYYDGSNNFAEIYQSSKNVQMGSYVGTISSSDPNTYPNNGIHSDGYWYVKQS